MSDYTFTRFTSPNAAPVVSTAGSDISTTAADGAALQNLDVNAVGLSTTDTLNNKTIGTGWKLALGSDGTGDIYYRDSSGNLTRLAIGQSAQVLAVSAGLPAWTAATSNNTFMQFFSGVGGVGIGTGYWGTTNSATENIVALPVAAAVTLTKLALKTNLAPGGSDTQTLTMRKNGADTAIPFVEGSAATTGSDTAHSATFAQFDLVAIKAVGTASAATTSGSLTAST